MYVSAETSLSQFRKSIPLILKVGAGARGDELPESDAFTSAEGASRQVLRRVLNGDAEALISLPLFAEYEAVLGRPETQRRSPLTAMEQTQLLDAFLSRTRLIEVYYRWRPNLPDEGDNHVLELAVAASDAGA